MVERIRPKLENLEHSNFIVEDFTKQLLESLWRKQKPMIEQALHQVAQQEREEFLKWANEITEEEIKIYGTDKHGISLEQIGEYGKLSREQKPQLQEEIDQKKEGFLNISTIAFHYATV